ncbi:MAG: hypothetical protein COW24_03580 [Candidatus Kerfeldbacteria bacterium CG15_BIG_FIL_POST_REV_8_21_14_020_45_12]|uniref:HAD family hydrolase n=1 Tax=Candidatus Kerfeldbacteria bacterium CG15_BIG_FIL_POST_REV_8_21_14_020_45_12 TaxID=2014247 RepID=A0A2M7H3F4_9BACT|nr:MAG: hypothetical protein COW24_03580 [Candidatus Kerfeldbacteria bacterium CG15_BIG_FIL_POST_REV_8_21_14_020_45_12]PJA93750.1 MAG: hypothetical protein CO132_01775 [Candidatus Kerfeldbacteria bacterium CG_4_9_14_3_um_filter_45_8]
MATLAEVIKPYPIVVWDLDHTIASLDVDWAGLKVELAAFCQAAVDLPYHELFSKAAQLDSQQAFALQAKYEAGVSYQIHQSIVETIRDTANNHTFAIFTDNLQATAERVLSELNILNLFASVVTKDQVTNWKPTATGLIKVMSNLNELDKAKYVLIGDSWKDQQAATEAEIAFVDIIPFQE